MVLSHLEARACDGRCLARVTPLVGRGATEGGTHACARSEQGLVAAGAACLACVRYVGVAFSPRNMCGVTSCMEAVEA